MSNSYPISSLFTSVGDLIHALDLPYEVKDVITFGHDPAAGTNGAMYLEVFTRDEDGNKNGVIRHTRFITRDTTYAEWTHKPTW